MRLYYLGPPPPPPARDKSVNGINYTKITESEFQMSIIVTIKKIHNPLQSGIFFLKSETKIMTTTTTIILQNHLSVK